MRLLRKTKCLPDESLASFIYRLAEVNYYNSPRIFKEALKVTEDQINGNNFSYENVRKVSNLVNGNVNDLYKRSIVNYFTNDNTINQLLFLRSRVKFCVHCIKAEPYHKWIWNINPIAICLNHSILLTDKCQSCNKKISFKSLMKKTCLSCGFEFINTKPILINPESFLYRSQKDLYSRLKEDEVDILPSLSFYEYIWLSKKVLFLFEDQKSFVHPTDETIHSFTRKSNGFFDNKKLLLALSNVYWMFNNFPDNFYQVLDNFEKVDYTIRKRRKKQFESILMEKKLLFMKQEYEKYKNLQILEGNTSANIAAYDKEGALKKKERFYTKKDVIRELGLKREQLENLICNGELKPKKVQRGKKVHYLFKKSSVLKITNELKNQQNDLITRVEAAEILGISYGRIQDLIDGNLLKLIRHPLEKGTFLSLKEVKDLINPSNVLYKESQSSDEISFLKVLDKYVTSGLSIQRIIYFMKNRKLTPTSNKKNPKLPDLFFYQKDIQNILHELKLQAQNEKGYSLQDVAKIMNMSERTIHKMIKHQLIQPKDVFVSRRGRILYRFSKETVEKFRETYLSTKEIEHEFQIPKSKIQNLVYRRKLKNYLSGVCSKILIRRKDIVDLISKTES